MIKNLLSFLFLFCFAMTSAFAADESKYDEYIEEASQLYGVDANFIKAIIKQESAFRDDIASGEVLSSAGAIGVMQLMPGTAEQMGFTPEQMTDPRTNIMAGTKYIQYLQSLSYIGNDPLLIAAGYNAGPGRVSEYGGVPPFDETVDYVQKVAGNYSNYAGIPPLDLSSVPPPSIPGGGIKGGIPGMSFSPAISADVASALNKFGKYLGFSDVSTLAFTIQSFLVFLLMLFGAYQIFRFLIGSVESNTRASFMESAVYSSRTMLLMVVLFSFITFT
jgi:hypothetical protein